MKIWCQLHLPQLGGWNNSAAELLLPTWEAPGSSVLSSLLASGTLEAWLLHPELMKPGTALLGEGWSTRASDLLHDIGCISQPARDRVCLQKASVFRTVSFGTSYPPLCLQNCFAPKQARSTPCCLNLSPFCLNWKIPLFLGGACCKTVGDIC